MPWPLPRCEVPHFAIISVVCQPYFWTNEQDLGVDGEYPAIKSKIPMDDGHTDVLKFVRSTIRHGFRIQNAMKDFEQLYELNLLLC